MWLPRALTARLQLPHSPSAGDVVAALRTKPVAIERFLPSTEPPTGCDGALTRAASTSSGAPFVKWWHYFPIYEEVLGPFVDRPGNESMTGPRLLEIGVWRGGSLELWRDLLGPRAVIFGVDIDPESAASDGRAGQVRIGSQADREFLRRTVDEMGGLDIVIDDGSHRSEDILTSLRVLWPLLAEGGTYVVEDLHASYWPAWGGGLRRRTSAIEGLKELVDVLHQPYFDARADTLHLGIPREELGAVCFYDSVAVLRKRRTGPPTPFRGGARVDT